MNSLFPPSFHNTTSHIVNTLEQAYWFERVTLSEEDSTLSCHHQFFHWQLLLPSIFDCFLSNAYKQENRETIHHLFALFGEKRVLDISKRNNLDLETKLSHGYSITRFDVEVIFGSMADVRIGDIQHIFHEIKSNPDRHFNLPKKTLEDLRTHFKDKQFNLLSKEDFDLLYQVAVPFNNIDTLFFNHPPENDLIDFLFSESTWKGRRRRIWSVEELRRGTECSQTAIDVRKAKRIMERFLPSGNQEGVIIPEKKGYRYVFRHANAGGCYQIFLKTLHPSSFTNQVAYLGTQTELETWESTFDDMRTIIGSRGAIHSFDSTYQLLYDPSQGFVSDATEAVSAIGFSLGGNHAIRHAIGMPNKITHVISLCNPGLDEDTLMHFANQTSKQLMSSLKVKLIWEKEDMATNIGFGHIGFQCDPSNIDLKLVILSPEEDREEDLLTRADVCHPLAFLWQWVYSIVFSHFRETPESEFSASSAKPCLTPYSMQVLSNQSPSHKPSLDECLYNGPNENQRLRREIHLLFGGQREDLFGSPAEYAKFLETKQNPFEPS